ncbi:unnamed protein product [Blepharisma stoltei]|uniref:Peptidase M14 domain-containing protein n=1 Tax=Blepharisma stoltei TaxID=1481888 RepID=A0AAU9K7X1_9CILI|nr:unnamed protein product [Blepharisma stoltei]
MNHTKSLSTDSPCPKPFPQSLSLLIDDSKEKFTSNSTTNEIVSNYLNKLLPNLTKPKQDLPTTNKSLLYRYESDGCVVYDSHSRRFDDSTQYNPLPPRMTPPAVLKDIENADEYDKNMLKSLPAFTPEKYVKCEYTLVAPTENVLIFDSKFESGNLWKAIKISENEYNLYLEYDYGTKGHTQWFYFSIKSYKRNHRVTLNIVNLSKYDSLYNNGMKPLVNSTEKYKNSGIQWHRAGENISYFRNNLNCKEDRKRNHAYTLSFIYNFEYENDLVYFAHCYPYTYTDLKNLLNSLQNCEEILRINTLCQTLAGNDCPVLTITESVTTYESWEIELQKLEKSAAWRKLQRLKSMRHRILKKETEHSKKKGIVISARVHPGESNSSYAMKGVIEFLLGNSKEAKILRKNFVFKIIPMLNPDGVIYGNYRCSLLGVDLNRRWIRPNRHLHPTIYYTKRLIKMFSEDMEVVMYCDIHGHSMKKNVFMYSCCSVGREIEDRRNNVLIKMIPLLLAEKNKIFSFKDSKFRIEKCKESTARIVIFREINLLNSYTLECSFYGPSHQASLQNRDPYDGEASGDAHMERCHLENLGSDLCKVCLIFCNPYLFKKKLKEILNQYRRSVPFNFNVKKNKESTENTENLEKDSSDSEIREEQEENINEEEFHLEEALKTIQNNESLMDLEQLWNIDELSDNDSESSMSEADDSRFELPEVSVLAKKKKTDKKILKNSAKRITASSVPPPKHRPIIPSTSRLEKYIPLRQMQFEKPQPTTEEVLEDHLENIYNLIQSWDKKLLKATSYLNTSANNSPARNEEKLPEIVKNAQPKPPKSEKPLSPTEFVKITSTGGGVDKQSSRRNYRSLIIKDDLDNSRRHAKYLDYNRIKRVSPASFIGRGADFMTFRKYK